MSECYQKPYSQTFLIYRSCNLCLNVILKTFQFVICQHYSSLSAVPVDTAKSEDSIVPQLSKCLKLEVVRGGGGGGIKLIK